MKMTMKKTTQQTDHHLVLIVFMMICSILLGSNNMIKLCSAAPPSPPPSSSSVEEKCNNEFSKVGVCLDYATGNTKAPSKECCTTVESIRKRDAVCLCYVIQQAHDGDATLKQLGVQEEKLIQLPHECKLTDINLSTDCPKLLNLSSTSPDYAFFTNTSSPSPAPSSHPPVEGAVLPKISNSSSSSSSSSSANTGFVHRRPHIAGPIINISFAIIIFISVLFP